MRWIVTDLAEVYALIDRHRGENFAADIETSGLNYRRDDIVGVALYFESQKAYYITIQHTKERWDGSTYLEHYIPIKTIEPALNGLFNQDVVICLHNSKFDLHFFDRQSIRMGATVFDTLLAAQLLDENRRNGLKELAPLVGIEYEKYQKHKKFRGFGVNDILGSTLEDTAQYAMNDVEATFKLYQKFSDQLMNPKEPMANDLKDVFWNIWMPLSQVLRKMEARGIRIDRERTKELYDEYTRLATDAKTDVLREGYRMLVERYNKGEELPGYYVKPVPSELHANVVERSDGSRYVELFGLEVPVWKPSVRSNERFIEFNPGSPKQMYELIYEYSGISIDPSIPLKYNASGSQLAVDKDNMKMLIFYIEDNIPPFIKALLKWKEYDKFITTYLNRLLSDTDDSYDRIHGNFNQAVNDQGTGGTVTGRLSSSSPNLQNIPSRGEIGERARRLYIASENNLLIAGDYNNFEMRILGHYSKDQTILKAFANDEDLHIAMGAQLLGVDYQTLMDRYKNGDDEAKRFRSLGKTLNFGITYGLGARKLVRFLLVNNEYEIDVEEAQRWIDLYNELYSGAFEWKERVREFVREHGYVKTILGRKRRLPEGLLRGYTYRKERSYAERRAVNSIIQGSCGDIICKAMIMLQPTLEAMGGSLLLQVHDELVMEVPEEMAPLAIKAAESMMVDWINPQLRCPLVVEAHAADNWYGAKQ